VTPTWHKLAILIALLHLALFIDLFNDLEILSKNSIFNHLVLSNANNNRHGTLHPGGDSNPLSSVLETDVGDHLKLFL
jgi:hypothetical protein